MSLESLFEGMETPRVVVDRMKLQQNINSMQEACNAGGVELWPHIKTHKCVEIARMQLQAGAAGLTCAKLSEAEAMIPSGVKRIFIAYPLVDPLNGRLIRHLSEWLEELILAVTGLQQAAALDELLRANNITADVMMAVDTGLGREGVRNPDEAKALAKFVRESGSLRLKGIFTHEGDKYISDWSRIDREVESVAEILREVAKQLGGSLDIWPGCSVTARIMARQKGITGVRPGAYLFGDLMLSSHTRPMRREDVALKVISKIVDFPDKSLALIDAGSKTFSSDKTPAGVMAEVESNSSLKVMRCNEEHGYLSSEGNGDLSELKLNQRLVFIPAHVCTVVNLTDSITIVEGDRKVGTWQVAARGKTR